MKIILLTQRSFGSPVAFLKLALQAKNIEVVAVFYSEGEIPNKKRYLIQKLKKLRKLGIGVLLSGWYLRRLFDERNIYKPEETLVEFCAKNKLNLIPIKRTNRPVKEDLLKFKKLSFDYGISIGNSFISPKIFTLAKQSFLNIHHEILPEYIGAHPIIWQLYNGSLNSGFSIHKMTSKIDEGEIVCQKVIPIKFLPNFKNTIIYNLQVIKKNSLHHLIDRLQKDEFTKLDISKRKAVHYTTPSLTQLSQIVKNFQKFKKQ